MRLSESLSRIEESGEPEYQGPERLFEEFLRALGNPRFKFGRAKLELMFGREAVKSLPTKRQLSFKTVAGQARRKRRLAKVEAREQRRNRNLKPVYEAGYHPPPRFRSLGAFF